MRRGDVWWANLPGPAGQRPVVLVSRNAAYAVRLSVTVAPLTTRIRGIETEVLVGPEDGLPQVSVVNLYDLLTVSKNRIFEYIAHLSPKKLRAVDSAIRFALDL